MNDNNRIQSFGFIEEYGDDSVKEVRGRKSFPSQPRKNMKDTSHLQSFDFIGANEEQKGPFDENTSSSAEATFDGEEVISNRFMSASNEVMTIGMFYERLNRAIAKEFSYDIWITGEVRKFRESKGHRYLELVDAVEIADQYPENQVANSFSHRATKSSSVNDKVLDVVCWRSNWATIENDLAQVGITLEEGRVVKVRGRVSVWEGAGRVRLIMNKLDIEALLGQIASQRLKLIFSLQERGIYDLNRQKILPVVPLRVGLVASPGSEGHKDFEGVLNRSGYNFQLFLQPSLVQGQEAARQISFAMDQCNQYGAAMDVICVVRGGGSKSDLAVFDSEEVVLSILRSPYPVWTGIGHTGDNSVVDMIANKSFPTPTACAEALVSAVESYYNSFTSRLEMIAKKVQDMLSKATFVLDKRRSNLEPIVLRNLKQHAKTYEYKLKTITEVCNKRLRENALLLDRKRDILEMLVRHSLAEKVNEIRSKQTLLSALDPKNQLARGWSLVRHADGKVVKSIQELTQADLLNIDIYDGSFEAEVITILADN